MLKVYVGNLASSVTSGDLLTHFSRAGEVVGALGLQIGHLDYAVVSALWRWQNSPTLRSRLAS